MCDTCRRLRSHPELGIQVLEGVIADILQHPVLLNATVQLSEIYGPDIVKEMVVKAIRRLASLLDKAELKMEAAGKERTHKGTPRVDDALDGILKKAFDNEEGKEC